MNFPYGEIVTEVPEGFVPYEQWPEYDHVAGIEPFLHPEQVGKKPVGARWGLWPLIFEAYTTDEEPVLKDSDPHHTAHNRLITWYRISRTNIPKGWLELPSRLSPLQGFANITSNKDYTAAWSESARRYRRKWRDTLLNKKYSFVRLTFTEFEQAYMKSIIAQRIKRVQIDMLARKIANNHPYELWGVRDNISSEIMSGMATIDSPVHKASFYHTGFIRSEVQHDPLMLGLMDRWFEESVKKDFLFLHFGWFWKRGDPSIWKGFSLFKAKFGLQYIQYKRPLIRLARGKFF